MDLRENLYYFLGLFFFSQPFKFRLFFSLSLFLLSILFIYRIYTSRFTSNVNSLSVCASMRHTHSVKKDRVRKREIQTKVWLLLELSALSLSLSLSHFSLSLALCLSTNEIVSFYLSLSTFAHSLHTTYIRCIYLMVATRWVNLNSVKFKDLPRISDSTRQKPK